MANNKQSINLELYREVAPTGTVDMIYRLSNNLKGKTILHINSTRYGGGVAEMLNRLIPLFNELGINTKWEVIEGSPLFFQTTKSFHNALQGKHINLPSEMYEEYMKVTKENGKRISIEADYIIVHDPQPAALIYKKKKNEKWLWRCHIDVSRPYRKVWNFLKEFIIKYDAAIFSLPAFAQKLPIPQFLIYPSIDPLSDKNKELNRKEIENILNKYNIPTDKPIILQVSRFDKFKDPLGVIETFKLVKKYNNCCLVLAGGEASDDPEGKDVLEEIKQVASEDKDIIILSLPPDSPLEINALQRASTIVLQKSIKEGFGLTVAEAMWKAKPVIASAVGGITSQIIFGKTGYTINSVEGCAYRIRYLLNNPKVAKMLGKNAKEFVRNNFLITRNIYDYLALFTYLLKRN